MRFMGFSSKVGKISMFALVGAFVASLGVVALPSEAEAQRGKRWVYAAKFKCISNGEVSTFIGPVNLAVQTVVNIYNPTEDSISFRKHFVIAAPQFKTISSAKTDATSHDVGAGLGHAINCRDIVTALEGKITPSSYIGDSFSSTIEGWVIIEHQKKEGELNKPILSVCANYQHALTAFGSSEIGAGITVDVECYEGKKVKPKF